MSKILVTGGAGFIGSHLVERLVKLGHKVVVLDDLSTGKILNLPRSKDVRLFRQSILDDTKKAYERVDVVFHLAALTRPRESFTNPMETNNTNVSGTLNVILNAKKTKVKRIVFTSSAAVYGNVIPKKESETPRPVSPYGLTKLTGEAYCRYFGGQIGINIVRPFNVYGKRQDPSGMYGAAIPKFIEALKTGTEPYITGDGEQYRDFVYIDDVIDLLILLAETDVVGQTFNGGSGRATTVYDLYHMICKIMKKNVRAKYVDEIEEPSTKADIWKASDMLGWKPKYTLEEGLRKII